MPTFKPFDVIVVPFHFTDSQASKRRPALVLSQPIGPTDAPHFLLAMITSARNRGWPLDVLLEHRERTGLPAPSVVRMKLFTLDAQLILRKIGALAVQDQQAVSSALRTLLPDALPS